MRLGIRATAFITVKSVLILLSAPNGSQLSHRNLSRPLTIEIAAVSESLGVHFCLHRTIRIHGTPQTFAQLAIKPGPFTLLPGTGRSFDWLPTKAIGQSLSYDLLTPLAFHRPSELQS